MLRSPFIFASPDDLRRKDPLLVFPLLRVFRLMEIRFWRLSSGAIVACCLVRVIIVLGFESAIIELTRAAGRLRWPISWTTESSHVWRWSAEALRSLLGAFACGSVRWPCRGPMSCSSVESLNLDSRRLWFLSCFLGNACFIFASLNLVQLPIYSLHGLDTERRFDDAIQLQQLDSAFIGPKTVAQCQVCRAKDIFKV